MKTSGLSQKHKDSRLTTGAFHLTTGRVSSINDRQLTLLFCPPESGHFFFFFWLLGHQEQHADYALIFLVLLQQQRVY